MVVSVGLLVLVRGFRLGECDGRVVVLLDMIRGWVHDTAGLASIAQIRGNQRVKCESGWKCHSDGHEKLSEGERGKEDGEERGRVATVGDEVVVVVAELRREEKPDVSDTVV